MIHYAMKSAIHRKQCWMTLNAVFFYNRKVTNLQLIEKIILFLIVFIKPNKDNSPILENFASHKKSTTSFFSLHLSPNPLQFIMIAFIKFPVIIIFLYTKISQKFVFIYWHSITNAVVCLATVLPIWDLYHHTQIKTSLL